MNMHMRGFGRSRLGCASIGRGRGHQRLALLASLSAESIGLDRPDILKQLY
jgi:hypothetical protein